MKLIVVKKAFSSTRRPNLVRSKHYCLSHRLIRIMGLLIFVKKAREQGIPCANGIYHGPRLHRWESLHKPITSNEQECPIRPKPHHRDFAAVAIAHLVHPLIRRAG